MAHDDRGYDGGPQLSLDRYWATTGDGRLRPPERYLDPGAAMDGDRLVWPNVGELTDAEQLMGPAAGSAPGTIIVQRSVEERASVAFRWNRESVSQDSPAWNSNCETASAWRHSMSCHRPGS